MSNTKAICFRVSDNDVIEGTILGLSLHMTDDETVSGIALLANYGPIIIDPEQKPIEFVVSGTARTLILGDEAEIILSLTGSTLFTTGEEIALVARLNQDASKGAATYAVKPEGKRPTVYKNQKVVRVECPKA